MEYSELTPPAALADHVQCLWRLRAPPASTVQTIYPDGRCEVIVHLAVPPRSWDAADGWQVQARTLFAAQRVVAVRLELRGELDCVGVRLRPAAANILLPRKSRIRNRIVDLATLDAAFSRALTRAVREFAAGTDASLWKLIGRRCAGSRIDARIAAAVDRIERSGGCTRVDALARASALSMRGFQIRFKAAVGLAPKEFTRVVRLQATLRALDSSNARLSDVVSDGGFADQAHATRELRRVTGLTPARLRAELRRDRDGDAAVRLAAAFIRGYSR
jgi:methylphosphotriester-DNA--protein-cysteine methyltransferase